MYIIFTGLFLILNKLIISEPSLSHNLATTESMGVPASGGERDNPTVPLKQNSKTSEPPFVIHYGLNDSHSRDWVKKNRNGVIGISYFEHYVDSYTDGILYYKTINLDGSVNIEEITSGTRLEKSVLLYDSLSRPHVFVAQSVTVDEIVNHYYKNDCGQWQSEIIFHFYNEGGKFIYELSADTGPDYSFHLLILKTRSNVDSDDFMDAWINSYLYHLTNSSGSWEKELVRNYDMVYTYDMYIKSSIRQDMEIDDSGYVHVVFGEQLSGTDDPSRLLYATNKTGTWKTEIALNYDPGSRDDAGWFPSLCLDNYGNPFITCVYIDRVYTHSALDCKLLLLSRLGENNWHSELITMTDDGYYGSDGRNYTGALSHLVFDSHNTPHIIFSDIASTHWPGSQRLNVGNIRYGKHENDNWNFTTIYRQQLPLGFFNATEMLWMCLVLSEETDSIRVIGQEIHVEGENDYSCQFVNFAWGECLTDVKDDKNKLLPDHYHLFQNYPNPFNPETSIKFDLPHRSRVVLSIYNILGRQINTLISDELPAGNHSCNWDGTDSNRNKVSTGIYFYRLKSEDFTETKKMLLLK